MSSHPDCDDFDWPPLLARLEAFPDDFQTGYRAGAHIGSCSVCRPWVIGRLFDGSEHEYFVETRAALETMMQKQQKKARLPSWDNN